MKMCLAQLKTFQCLQNTLRFQNFLKFNLSIIINMLQSWQTGTILETIIRKNMDWKFYSNFELILDNKLKWWTKYSSRMMRTLKTNTWPWNQRFLVCTDITRHCQKSFKIILEWKIYIWDCSINLLIGHMKRKKMH